MHFRVTSEQGAKEGTTTTRGGGRETWKERRDRERRDKGTVIGDTGAHANTGATVGKPGFEGPREARDPCRGCGAHERHKSGTNPALSQKGCPLRLHPDWYSKDCEFKDSAAAKAIAVHKVLHINSKGTVTTTGELLNRLSPFYRAHLDRGQHVKIISIR